VHLQLASRLGFQLANGRREVTGEDGRVRPLRVGVAVVSFMIVVPFALEASVVGGLSPVLRTPQPRSDTASRISFEVEPGVNPV
jgi:hypothetical protein